MAGVTASIVSSGVTRCSTEMVSLGSWVEGSDVSQPGQGLGICSVCGAECSGRFCAACGGAVVAAAESAPQFCPNCGMRTSDDSTFCPSCGQVVGALRAAGATPAGTSQTGGSGAVAWAQLTSGWTGSVVGNATGRTAAAWGVVLVLLTLLMSVTNGAVWGDGDVRLSSFSAAIGVIILGLGGSVTLTGGVSSILGDSDLYQASIILRFAPLVVPLLIVVALRVARIGMRQRADKVRYAAVSAAVSVVVVVVLAAAASGTLNLRDYTEYVALRFSFTYLIPSLFVIGLALLAVLGLPRNSAWPDLALSVRALCRLGVIAVFLTSLAVLVGWGIVGLRSGTGAISGFGFWGFLGATVGLTAALPNLAIYGVAAALGMRPRWGVSGDLSDLDYTDMSTSDIASANAAITDWPQWAVALTWVALIAILVGLVWFVVRNTERGSSLLWLAMGGTFAVLGPLVLWLASPAVSVRSQVGTVGGVVTVHGFFGLLDFGVRLAVLGGLAGLAGHPAVRPYVSRYLPARDARKEGGSSRSLRPLTEPRPGESQPPRVLGGGALVAVAGVVAAGSLAVILYLAGMGMYAVHTAVKGGPETIAADLQQALRSGDGEQLATIVAGTGEGDAVAPLSAAGGEPEAKVELRESGMSADVSWPGGDGGSVNFYPTYDSWFGLLPSWQTGPVDLPEVTGEVTGQGASTGLLEVSLDGQVIPSEGLTVMPGEHELQVPDLGGDFTVKPSSQMTRIAESGSLDVDYELSDQGKTNAIAAANEAAKTCTAQIAYCPSSFQAWVGSVPAVSIADARFEDQYDDEELIVVKGPEFPYEYRISSSGSAFRGRWDFAIPVTFSDGSWRAVDTQPYS